MRFTFSDELRSYVVKHSIHGIMIEVVTCDHTDLEITDLHVHFVSLKQAERLCRSGKLRRVDTDFCPVYLPKYKLEYDDTVLFALKSFGPLHWIRYEGIHL